MDRTERFYKIHRLLTQRRFVGREDFLEELGVSRATFKRDLEYLRDRFNMPIVWDRDCGCVHGAGPRGRGRHNAAPSPPVGRRRISQWQTRSRSAM